MTRSLGSSAALLSIVLLMSSASLSAKTGGASGQTHVRAATQLIATTSAVPSQVLTIWAGAIYDGGDEGFKSKDRDKDTDIDKDRDGDKDNHHHDGDGDKDNHHRDGDGDKDDHSHHHEPTPEPSTLLSFGAAILIGGGVLYSRRLRGTKK